MTTFLSKKHIKTTLCQTKKYFLMNISDDQQERPLKTGKSSMFFSDHFHTSPDKSKYIHRLCNFLPWLLWCQAVSSPAVTNPLTVKQSSSLSPLMASQQGTDNPVVLEHPWHIFKTPSGPFDGWWHHCFLMWERWCYVWWCNGAFVIEMQIKKKPVTSTLFWRTGNVCETEGNHRLCFICHVQR